MFVIIHEILSSQLKTSALSRDMSQIKLVTAPQKSSLANKHIRWECSIFLMEVEEGQCNSATA